MPALYCNNGKAHRLHDEPFLTRLPIMNKEEIKTKKQILSCIQPTGEMHLGNYFGAVKNWVKLQEIYNCLYGVVDYHAITVPYDPNKLRQLSMQLIIDLRACGVAPETLFIQSLVPEHAELAWILGAFTSYGELSRMTQFKDKSSQVKETDKDYFVSAGLFNYPVLQAADILIYHAHYVPVGKDQEQHLELSRNIAARFNNRFNTEYFTEPKPLFTEIPKLMSLADPTKKMSKSLGVKHVIGLFEDENIIRKKVRSAVTDSGNLPDGEMSEGIANLFRLLQSCEKMEEYDHFMALHGKGELRYGDFKNAVADAIVELTDSFKAKRTDLMSNRKKVKDEVMESSANIRKLAQKTLKEVRSISGMAKLRYFS